MGFRSVKKKSWKLVTASINKPKFSEGEGQQHRGRGGKDPKWRPSKSGLIGVHPIKPIVHTHGPDASIRCICLISSIWFRPTSPWTTWSSSWMSSNASMNLIMPKTWLNSLAIYFHNINMIDLRAMSNNFESKVMWLLKKSYWPDTKHGMILGWLEISWPTKFLGTIDKSKPQDPSRTLWITVDFLDNLG